ncbi:retention module-containing protein [Pseudomonas sp. NY15435]|uniref:retention module-containing protein n=1 Tax=Pseudomonas sp. NY15435 TaxID=3400358 RepID=UPI003A8C3669
MSSVVAVVKSIIGQVIAVSPEGAQRVLVEGDRIYQGEQLLTGASGAVTLDVGKGKLVDLGRDSQWSSADLPQAEAHHAAAQPVNAPSTEDLQKAIAAGLDPTQALAPTAAGPTAAPSAAGGNGGVGGGHSFVVLDATAGRVDPNIGYSTAGLDNGGAAADERQGELPPNLAPAFTDGSNGVLNLTTAEDTLLTGAFSARDPNGDLISYSVGQAPGNGLLVLNPNGTWQYNPNGDYNGADSFTVIVTDARGATSTLVVNVGITPVNDAPVATGTYTSAITDTAANDSFADIKGQLTATDVDDTNLTWSGSAKGTYGELTVNADGSYTYVVDANAVNALPLGQNPSENFTVTVTDPSGATDTRVITINVQGANDTPVAQDGQASGNEDSLIGGQLVATDRDTGSSLTFTTNGNPPAGFTLKPDGRWTFDGNDPAYQHLAEGETLVVQVPYTVTDEHGATSTATLTVTLTGTNDAPVALPGAATTEENTVLNGQVPAASDVDGNVAGYQLTTGVGNGNGNLTFNPDGSYSFNPGKDFDSLAQGETRDVTFTYQAKDNNGALSDPQTITITVTGTNDAAVIGGQGSASADETDAPLTLDGKLTISDVDSPASFQVQNNTAGQYGKFSVGADGSWSYVANDAYNELKVGEHLSETFTVLAADGTSTSVTVTINGTNDAPVAYADSKTTEENTGLSGQVPAATDVDGSVVGYQLATGVGQGNGSLTFNTDGSYSFNPGKDFDGLAEGESRDITFTYQAKDDNGALSAPQTITITVTGSNDAPIASATSGAVQEDAQISGQLAATDADDGAKLTYTLDKTAPAGFSVDADGKWTFDASSSEYQHLKAGATQTISIPFTVTDEHGATSSSSLTITVTGTNDAPVANAAAAKASEDKLSFGKLTASDVDDGAKLSFSLNDKAPAGFTLFKDGTWAFSGLDPAYQSLAAGETKVLSIDYTVTDEHGATSTNTLTLTVTGTNDTPIALPSLINPVKEDAQISGTLKAIDVDNGAQLTYSLNKAAPAGLTLGSDGKWSFDASDAAYQHLKAGATQLISVGYTVTDEHGAKTSSLLVITVTGTNDAPKADAATAAAQEDAVSKGQLTATDVDDGAKLSFSVSGNPPAGFTLKTDGSWTFDGKDPAYQALAEGETKDIQVKYIVTDEHGATDTQTLTITVTGSNDAPVAYADTVTTEENTVLNGQVPAATDVDGTIASYQLTSDVAQGKGSLTFNADGSYTFTPGKDFDHLADGQSDTVTFTYQAKDNNGALSDPQTITITVTGSNDAPVASTTSDKANEDAKISGQLAATDADDGAKLTYTLDKAAPAGFSVDADGKWTFDASASEYQHLKAGATQTIQVPFTVTDEHGATSSSSLTITITGTNDAPIANAASASVTEDKLSIGKLTASDIDDGAKLSFSLNGKAPAGFALGKDGSWIFNGLDPAYQSLAAGETKVLSIDYTVTDEHGATSTNTLTLTVTGTNDTPIALPSLINPVKEDAQISGTLKAIDVDNGAQLTFTTGKLPAGLTVGSDGQWNFNAGDAAYQHLKAGATQIISVPFTVTDEHGAKTSSLLVITVTGTNDAPVANAAANVAATEDQVSQGQFTASDVDDGAKLSFSVSGNPPAGFTLKTDGSWTFDGKNPAYQSLAEGETKDIQVKFIVTDEHGATDTQTLTITVTGTNDAAVITGQNSGSANETDAPVTIGGKLDVTDVDSPAVFQSQTNTAGDHGKFSIGTDGTWSYVANSAYNELKAGEHLTDSFTVKAADGTSTTVTVTINGTNDKPVASADTATTEENTVLHGQVPVATDIDGTIASYELASGVAQGKGSLTFNADGSYTFTPGTAFDHLAAGASEDVTFTYQAKDNNGALSDPQTITITVTGTNDAAVITGQNSGSANETDAPVTIGGKLDVTDVDSPAVFQSQTNTAGDHGKFSIGTDGTWSYVANSAYNELKAGEHLTDSFTVKAADGTSTTVTVTINGTNDKPVASADTATTEENTVLHGQVPVATDIDGTIASYELASGVAQGKGSLTFNADGSYTFNPGTAFDHLAAGQSENVTFTYQAKDNDGALSDPQTITITVTGTNDAAVITGQTNGSANETDAPVTIGGKLNVTDVDSPAVFQSQTNTAGDYGKFSIGANGAWTYVADSAYNELKVGEKLTDSFTVKAADGTSTTVTVTINGTNDKPVAFSDTATTEENTVLHGQVPVATDIDGAVVRYEITKDVGQGKGTLTFNNDGSYTFNPGTAFDHLAAGQTENVTFTYQAKDNDGAVSDQQTITITVTGTNDAAVITGQTGINAYEADAPLTLGGKLNVTDVDSPASFQAQNNVSGAYGKFSIGADGNWSYIANSAYNQLNVGDRLTDTFTVKAADGTSTTVTVTINGTNDKPVAFSDTATTGENAVLQGKVPVATDIDGTVVNYQLTTGLAAGKGTLSFSPNGTYTFNPGTAFDHLAQGQSENVTFTYQARDNSGALSDPQTITITVTGTNDKPVAYADTQTTEENTVLNAQVPTATDVDGTIAGYQLATDVAAGKGTLVFNTDGSYTFTPGTAFDHLGAGQSENVTFTYQAKDNNGALSDAKTITITVTGTNDNPVAVPDTAHTNEDTAIRIEVLGNDTDAEGDSLLVTGASAGNGTVVINQDGSLSYTPKENFSGSDTITYTISDGKGGTATSTVAVSIEAVADKPNLSLDGSTTHPKATGLTVDTWTGLALGNGGNGAAPDDLQAKIDAAGTPTTHGSTDSVRNTDVTAGTATKVSGLIFLEAGHTYTFTGVGDDSVRLVIGGSTVAEATWGGSSGKFSGSFTPTESGYYPIALYQHNQSGPGNYTLSISDNGSTAQVLGTGSAQVFHNTGELTTGGERLSDLTGSSGQTHYKVFGLNEGNEDTAINLSKIKAALVDTDGSETLSVSIGKIPAGATLSDGKNSFTADATHNSIDLKGWNLDTLTLTPPADFNGTIKLEVSATATESSNNDAATRTVDLNVTVYPVNDAPTVSGAQNLTTDEDTSVNGQIHARDVDGDTLSYAVKNGSGPAHGSVTFGSDGQYTYTPAKDYNGSDSFTVVVSDGKGGSVEQVVNVGINPVNDAPTTADQSKTVAEDSPLTGKIIASDVEGDTLSYAVKSGVTHGTLVLNTATGDYTYTPAANYNGPDGFTITVSDGKGGTANSVVNITVTPVNDAPVFNAPSNTTTPEDTVLTGKVSATDVDGDSLTYSLKSGPSHGSIVVDAAGNYTYTPSKDYNGGDSFTVTVNDGHGGVVDQLVNLTITPVNDAPEAKNDSKSTGENSPLSGQVPTATDVDSSVNPNGYALVQGVGNGNGSLTFNANGSYVFNPGTDFDSLAPGESRQVTFTYTAKDAQGAVSAPATVTITVNGANDAPNGADKAITLDEDTSRSFSAGDFGFTDIDHNDALSAVRIDSLPTNGSLKLNGAAVTAGQVIDAADLGKLVFTPAANANGTNYANFTFSVKDSNGAFDATPNKITLNVTPVNDNPVAVNDNFTVSGLKGNYWGYNEGPDGSNLTSLSQVTAFMNGHAASATFTSTTLNYNLSGGDLGGDGNLQKFLGNDAGSLNTDPANTSDAIIQLTGAINLNAGSYQLRVNADDGFSIKIDGVEVFKYDAIQSPTGRESAVFNIAQSGNHTIEIIYWDQGGQAQLQVEMRPQGGTYTTVGGTALTHAVGELVTNEDTALTIAPKTLLGNDSDVDGDSLTILSVQNPVNGTVALVNGNVVFTPAKDFNGSGSFTYTISDGHGGTSTATVTVGVNAVNDAPEAKNDLQTTGENNTLNGQVPAATDIDSAVNPTGYALVQGVGAGNGSLTFNANGSYVFNPGTDFDSLNVGESRQVTFTYTAKDAQGAVSAPATVTITVTGSNDLPTATDSTVTLNEDGKRSFSASDFGFSDKDAGDALKAIRIDNLPSAGSLTLNGQSVTAGQVIAVSLLASLVYTPVANAAGNAYATLKFSVQDSHDGFSSSPSTLTFNVTPVNDAPLSADGSASIYAGKTYTFALKDFAFSDTADSANGQNHSLQNILIKALPATGSLLLNGQAVTAGQSIKASDVSSGKLTYVPDSSGSNAHFDFAVQDSGGVANGGVDTSGTYGFDIHVGQVQIPGTTPNGDNTLTGGSGDDVILGDVGGLLTTTQPGTNYNIALVVDTSGSMAYNLAGNSGAAYADSRMKLIKDALINLANELKGHDGVINISLIGFSASASIKVSIADLNNGNVDQLINAIGKTQTTGLQADGGTNYQSAFEQAVTWFNGQKNGYENLTLFLTDGDPTYSKNYGSGNSTTYDVVRESVQSFSTLSDLSDVRAIGIGSGVNADLLKFFDNSNITGTGSLSFGSTSLTSTLHDFNNGSLSGWTLSSKGTGNGSTVEFPWFSSNGYLHMVDTNASGSTTAISPNMTVAAGSTSTFSFGVSESMRNGDDFVWKLEKLVGGVWTQADTGTVNFQTGDATITTKSVDGGSYRFDFILTDNTNQGTATVDIDNIKQVTSTPTLVSGPTGQVDIVKQASDLTAALHGGSSSSELAPSGHDTISGGAGDDIIFGDTINTDNLPWGVNGNPAKPADMPAGSGVSALSAFLELKNGHAATSDEMYDYIKTNHALFNVEGDTRGGDDHLYGGDGNDILYGQGGNDFLFGENGNDILFGGTGNDQLTGGKGNDILTGGAGADTFIWKAGDIGNDTITDFKAGEGDRIDISDLLPETAHNDILSYLKVDTTTSTLQVSTTGQINNGGAADVTIKLSGVDLSAYGSTSTEIVNKLVAGSDPVVKTEHH